MKKNFFCCAIFLPILISFLIPTVIPAKQEVITLTSRYDPQNGGMKITLPYLQDVPEKKDTGVVVFPLYFLPDPSAGNWAASSIHNRSS